MTLQKDYIIHFTQEDIGKYITLKSFMVIIFKTIKQRANLSRD